MYIKTYNADIILALSSQVEKETKRKLISITFRILCKKLNSLELRISMFVVGPSIHPLVYPVL